VVIVPTNEERIGVNRHFQQAFIRAHPLDADAGWRRQGILRVDAELVFDPADVSPGEKKQVLNELAKPKLRLHKQSASTGDDLNRDLHLRLIFGAPYMVLQNVSVQSGIANGTLCELMDVLLREGVVPQMDMEEGVCFVKAGDVQGLVRIPICPEHALAMGCCAHAATCCFCRCTGGKRWQNVRGASLVQCQSPLASP
jgi:hypothetical protein